MKGRNFKESEDAVSPVIGVILMVAITVILAAVIGAFVLGMGSGIQKTYIVGVTAAQTNTNRVDVTFQGGPDADMVNYMWVNIGNVPFGRADTTTSEATAASDNLVPTFGEDNSATVAVGTTVTLNDSAATTDLITSGRDHLIVTATFMDGTKQVVLDTYV